jgi:predicted ATP-binding protein involved in virulence
VIGNLDCDVRNLVLLIIGIVHRCIKLNPHMGLLALVQSPGIVVIDGSRLPNQWHSHVVAELVVVFPAIQFILVCGARSLDR